MRVETVRDTNKECREMGGQGERRETEKRIKEEEKYIVDEKRAGEDREERSMGGRKREEKGQGTIKKCSKAGGPGERRGEQYGRKREGRKETGHK